MENASKALIIAGAILLAILIIGLGMYIYQQASSAANGTNLDPQKANAYNAEFLQYEGTRSGTDTQALVSAIKNHNRVNVDDPTRQISVNYGTAPEEDTTEEPVASLDDVEMPPSGAIKSGWTYKITFSYSKGGYITNCYIIESRDSDHSCFDPS